MRSLSLPPLKASRCLFRTKPDHRLSQRLLWLLTLLLVLVVALIASTGLAAERAVTTLYIKKLNQGGLPPAAEVLIVRHRAIPAPDPLYSLLTDELTREGYQEVKNPLTAIVHGACLTDTLLLSFMYNLSCLDFHSSRGKIRLYQVSPAPLHPNAQSLLKDANRFFQWLYNVRNA